MTDTIDNSIPADAERPLTATVRATARALRTQFAQAARAGADDPQTVVDDIEARIRAVVSDEDYATTVATLEAIAREFGADTETGPCEHRGHGHKGHHGHKGRRGMGGFGPFGVPGFAPADAGRHDDGHGRRGHGRGRGFGPAGFGRPGFGPGADTEASFERGFEAGFRSASRG